MELNDAGRPLCGRGQYLFEIFTEFLHRREPFRGSLHDLRLCLKNLSPIFLDEHAHDLAHAPAWRSNHLEASGSCLQERDIAVTQDADGIRVSLEGLQLKTS